MPIPMLAKVMAPSNKQIARYFSLQLGDSLSLTRSDQDVGVRDERLETRRLLLTLAHGRLEDEELKT